MSDDTKLPLLESTIIYKVARQEDSKIFNMTVPYKGSSYCDAGYFYAPHNPFGPSFTIKSVLDRIESNWQFLFTTIDENNIYLLPNQWYLSVNANLEVQAYISIPRDLLEPKQWSLERALGQRKPTEESITKMTASLKQMVDKGKQVHFEFYRNKQLWYKTDDGFQFPVPIDDCGDAVFKDNDKAILFMRYIRKHLEYLDDARIHQNPTLMPPYNVVDQNQPITKIDLADLKPIPQECDQVQRGEQ